MKINIKSLKFRAKKELKDFINEKVSKLSRFDDKIISAEITLTHVAAKTEIFIFI